MNPYLSAVTFSSPRSFVFNLPVAFRINDNVHFSLLDRCSSMSDKNFSSAWTLKNASFLIFSFEIIETSVDF